MLLFFILFVVLFILFIVNYIDIEFSLVASFIISALIFLLSVIIINNTFEQKEYVEYRKIKCLDMENKFYLYSHFLSSSSGSNKIKYVCMEETGDNKNAYMIKEYDVSEVAIVESNEIPHIEHVSYKFNRKDNPIIFTLVGDLKSNTKYYIYIPKGSVTSDYYNVNIQDIVD